MTKLYTWRRRQQPQLAAVAYCKTRKLSCRWGKRATAYTVPVVVLTFKVIQV